MVGITPPEDKNMLPYIIAIFQIMGLVSAFYAVMHTRTSQGAIAWAICLITFPYLAVPAYWVFGRNRFMGYVSSKRALADSIDDFGDEVIERVRAHGVPDEEKTAEMSAAERLVEFPVLQNNAVELLIDGQETFDSIFAGIQAAKDFVLVQFYIVRDDKLGTQLQQHMIRKAGEGVRVYFLYDEMGSIELSKTYLAELRSAGVEVSEFNTRKGPSNRFQVNFRNHRKIVVVDGRLAWIGGHNVGDEYLGQGELGEWRDTHMKIEGPAALEAQLCFVQDWHWARDEIIRLDWSPQGSEEGKARVLIAPSGPADPVETAALMFLEAINSARSRLWIASPYFIPDQSIIAALQMAGLRGVDIRILIPANPDHQLVYHAAYAYFDSATRTGAKIYKYNTGFLHEKVVLVDDRTAVVGTANFDNRSFRLNFEVSAVVNDADFILAVEKMFLADFEDSRLVSPEDYSAQSIWFRFKVRFANLFASQL
jgi:cardiolipin synthase